MSDQITNYITQVQTIKDVADSDAAVQQTTVDGLKSQLKSVQNLQTADALVSTAMAELLDSLAALQPAPPAIQAPAAPAVSPVPPVEMAVSLLDPVPAVPVA